MLFFFSLNPFYGSQITFPTHATPISDKILNDPQFRFFDQCIGAVDGTHIQAFVSPDEHFHMYNHKGFFISKLSFICNFHFHFLYSLCGWDGSMSDASLWTDTYINNL